MSSDGNSTCNNTFDDKIYTAVAAVSAAGGGISLLACLYVVFIIVLFKKWVLFSQRLILYLALGIATISLSFLLQRVNYQNQTSPPYNNFCIFAGFLAQIGGWMALNANICIMVTLIAGVLTSWVPEKLEVFFVPFIFVFPFTFNWIPFIKLAYGRAGAWCWIRSQNLDCQDFIFGQVLQQVLWYVPLYLTMFILLIFYIAVVIQVYRKRKRWTGTYNPTAEKEKKIKAEMELEILSLIIYPAFFFILYFPALINRLQSLFDSGNPAAVLWFISAIFRTMQGCAVAAIFSFESDTRKNLKPANFRAAINDFCSKKRVEEYPLEESLESSIQERDREPLTDYHQWSQEKLIN